MSVMTSFTRRSLAKNRARTAVSIIGIALSVALITAIWTTVASLQQGLYQRTVATEGWWQAYASGASADEVDALGDSDDVSDVATSVDEGAALFSESERNYYGTGLVLKTFPRAEKGVIERDGAPIMVLPDVVEGRMPQADGEVLLPDLLRGVALGADGGGAVSDGPLQEGSTLVLDTLLYAAGDGTSVASSGDALNALESGIEVVDAQGSPVEGYGASFDGSETNPAEGTVQLVARDRRSFTVVGFYDVASARFFGNDFAASRSGALSAVTAPAPSPVAAPGEGFTEAWAATQGLATVDAIRQTMEGVFEAGDPANTNLAESSDVPRANLDASATAPFILHTNLFRYQGISDGSLLQNSLFAMAGILALVVAVASVSLIYNSFAISVAERTRQFGLLASLGASKRQLRRSVLVEALMLGAVGIPVGMVCGVAGTAAVLQLTGAGFAAMLGGTGGVTLSIQPVPLLIAAAISLAVLLVSAWVPAVRASHVSAVDAIRQVQDVKLSRRARRKANQAARAAAVEAAGSGCASSAAGSGGRDAEAAAFAAGREASGCSGATVVPFARGKGGGLWGRIAGVPGTIAHRNLSRASARGRTVVASLAVSVMLVVACGSVADFLDPVYGRAASAAGATADADVLAIVSAADMSQEDLSQLDGGVDELERRASGIAGAQVTGAVRQGQVETVMPAGVLTDEGAKAIAGHEGLMSEDWIPSPIGSDGAYYGTATVFYVDDASWDALAQKAGVDPASCRDPQHPQAIALNDYEGVTADGQYESVVPFAHAGTIRLYYGVQEPDGFVDLGVMEGADGQVEVGLLDQASVMEETGSEDAQPRIERVPAGQVARTVDVEIAALVDEEPAVLNVAGASRQAPVLIMPAQACAWFASGESASADGAGQETGEGASAAGTESSATDISEAASPSAGAVSDETATDVAAGVADAANPFGYSWAAVLVSADDHVRVAEELSAAGDEISDVRVSVSDVTEDIEGTRLSMQTVQVFILCFTVITALIAVANVFNTLTNSIMLRTREFAMLKSVGMGERAFARMLVCECASYALRGLAIGMVVAVLVAFALYQASSLAFANVGFSLPWAYVGAAVALVLVVLAISVAFALRKSHAANVVEALRADAA